MRYAMAIDTKKCVGCSDCVVACQIENDVPIGYCRDWIVEKQVATHTTVWSPSYFLHVYSPVQIHHKGEVINIPYVSIQQCMIP